METLKGKIFYEVEATAQNAMAQLVAILESASEKLFEQWQKQWSQRTVKVAFLNIAAYIKKKPVKRGTCNVTIEFCPRKRKILNINVLPFHTNYKTEGGPGSVVGIATGYGLDGHGIESRWGRDFPHLSRPALGPTQLPVQWVPVLSRGKERPGRDADPSPPSSAVGHERIELYLYSPYGPYGLYRASVPV